MISTDVNKSTN